MADFGRALGYLGGGLLGGIGEGMVEEAKGRAARDAFRAKLQADRDAADLKHERDIERDEAKHTRSQGEVTRTETDAEGNVFGVTRAGATKALGIKSLPGGSKNQDTANIKNARFAVEIGAAPDLKTAWQMEQSRATMSDADRRAKALAWVSKQEDKLGRQKYNTPEQMAGAMDAYLKFLDGDARGAQESLVKIDPNAKKKEDEGPGILKDMYDSVFGGAEAPATPTSEQATQPAGGDLKLTPQEQRIVDYHRNSIETGAVGTGPNGEPMTVYSTGIQIPEGKYKGKFVSVPGWVNGKVLSEREAYDHWKAEIHAGKWPMYESGQALNRRSQEIHTIMDDEEGQARGARDGTSQPKPQGQGTETDPYRPTSQEEFNALPPNKVFVNPADGKLYRKK